MAALTGDAGTNAALVQLALQKGSVVPISSKQEKENTKEAKEKQDSPQEKDKEQFLDVMLRGRRRLQQTCSKHRLRAFDHQST